jgi:pimeloyl-ACP methyl ester carboxylesterase
VDDRSGFRIAEGPPEACRLHAFHVPLPVDARAAAEITEALAETLHKAGPQVHVVGHSLGGIIALDTFLTHADLPPGRLVLMGAPVRGARAAQALARHPIGQAILGPLALEELATPRERNWSLPREVGLIAGSRSIGLGRFLADLPEPNDGTVAVDDRLPGAGASCMTSVTSGCCSRPR